MIAAIDNTFLTLLLNPKAAPRPNPETGQPASFCRERIEALIDRLSQDNGILLVPAPALAEALCAADAIEAYITELQQYEAIEIAAFDGRAACELGRVIRSSIKAGDKRSGQTGAWQHFA